MKIYRTHHAFCDQTIFVNIQMTDEEYRALKRFMKVCEKGYKGPDVCFPYGVRLVKQNYGWYKLMPLNFESGVRKISFTLKRPIAEFLEQQRSTKAETAARQKHAKENNVQVVAFSNAHSKGEYLYIGYNAIPDTQVAKPAVHHEQPIPVQTQPEATKPAVDINKLNNLAMRLGGKSLRVK